MTKTEHLKLPQWDLTDQVRMKDFNDAFASIDKDCGNCRIFAGTYVGTGEYDKAHPNKLEFSFRPLFIFMDVSTVRTYGIAPEHYIFVRPAANAGAPDNSPSNYLTWTEHGVSWYFSPFGDSQEEAAKKQFNTLGQTYQYIAVGI